MRKRGRKRNHSDSEATRSRSKRNRKSHENQDRRADGDRDRKSHENRNKRVNENRNRKSHNKNKGSRDNYHNQSGKSGSKQWESHDNQHRHERKHGKRHHERKEKSSSDYDRVRKDQRFARDKYVVRRYKHNQLNDFDFSMSCSFDHSFDFKLPKKMTRRHS